MRSAVVLARAEYIRGTFEKIKVNSSDIPSDKKEIHVASRRAYHRPVPLYWAFIGADCGSPLLLLYSCTPYA